jgi:HTTM domain
MNNKFRSFRAFLSIPHRLYGLAFLRITLGTVMLVNYVSHAREWLFLWGTEGMIPYSLFVVIMKLRHSFSLYAISPAVSWQIFLHLFGIAVAMAFVLGWHTRITTVLFAVNTWSLYERNPYLLDGGDNLFYLLVFWLMFCDSGRKLSLDSSQTYSASTSPYRNLVHNFGLAGILTQVTILYATSALAKIAGHRWQNGTALYYILRTDEFNLSPFTPFLWKHSAVIVLLTYSTMAFQISWPFLIWSRRFRLAAVLGALMLHGMIAYFMGLTWFSLVMVAAEFALFDDAEYIHYGVIISSALERSMHLLSGRVTLGRRESESVLEGNQ